MNKILLLFLLFPFFACEQNQSVIVGDECYQLADGTHLPRLVSYKNKLLISHVSSEADDPSLHTVWAAPLVQGYGFDSAWILVKSDTNLFINWADFPSVAPYTLPNGDDALFGHWLSYSGLGTYDYDIRYTPFASSYTHYDLKLHQDTVSAEHGFLSSAQLPHGDLQVSWLDGRYTKQQTGADAGAVKAEKQGHDHGHAGGAMTLRTTTVGSREANALSDSVSVELDHRVCDCCNTATVATDSLIMVAYRDRSEHEIRDIAFVTKPTTGGKWSTPKLVHADNWEITGCPVNGPALAANASGDIAIIWYTAANDYARIYFARYDPLSGAFSSPILLDDNNPLGRVDLQLTADGTAYATALLTTESTDDALLALWTISPDGQTRRKILTTTSPARSSGFPKIAWHQGQLFWARTVVGKQPGAQHVEVCWR